MIRVTTIKILIFFKFSLDFSLVSKYSISDYFSRTSPGGPYNMLKSAFHAFLLIAVAALTTAAKPVVLTPQERFDKLAEHTTFGEAELAELRAIMELVKERKSDEANKDGDGLDCTFCPDALTWYLSTNDLFDEFIFLVDHKADFGIKDENGMTLLQEACKGGHVDIIEFLIHHGGEVNLPDKRGRSAIHYALMGHNPELVLYLLEHGSDPNKRTTRNETPLHFAAKYTSRQELETLVEHGASIKAINWTLVENLIEQRNRQDKLYYDSDEKHIASLKKALGLKTPESLEEDFEDEEGNDEEEPRYEEVDDDDDDGGERYVEAEASSDAPKKAPSSSEKQKSGTIANIEDIPFYLLPRDVNDAATVDGLTALHYAAQNGSLDIIKYLVEHGADISAQDYEQSRSVIHFAAENGDIECIKYLTEHGANLQDKDANGATAFHYAVMANNLEAVKYFVTKKLDYTAKDNRGWTAMHYAANGGALDVMKYLIAKGLNINELNNRKRTPLFFAREHRDLRQYMISKGAK